MIDTIEQWSSSFDAILFDMDGTLVDTERHTDTAIREVLEPYGIEEGFLKPEFTAGRTWLFICETLFAKYPILQQHTELHTLERELIDAWGILAEQGAEEIPGACKAVREASQYLKVSVVSGSPRHLIDTLMGHLQLDAWFPEEARVGGDEVTASKPSPEGFLLGASRLGVEPTRCLVFEDSIAGIHAARAAGAASVAVLHSCKEPDVCSAAADYSIQSFETLPNGFWQMLAK